jgi:RNA-directed DNA polymerase
MEESQMTVEAILTGAPSTYTKMTWQSIDWHKVEEQVKRLQLRIAKAKRAGKHSKVKALQWILTHSFFAKLLAVKRVTQNRGSRTVGVDKVSWKKDIDKVQAAKSLKRRAYKALPLKRIYIPKKNGKRRPLGIPTMKDRAMQALYLLALEPISETQADRHSYGFRPYRSAADAIKQTFFVLARKVSAQWILEGDIKGCFDNINHNWLQNNIPMDNKVLHQWLKAGYMEKQCLFPTEEGTPQGGTISPTLANMTLDGLEKVVTNCTHPSNKVNVIRYADDFIITANSQVVLEDIVKPAVVTFLRERGLTLSEEKTKITHISKGFNFLGFNVRKYKNEKLLIKPAKDSIKTFLKNVREIIKFASALKTQAIIGQLNPKIRGWVYYYRHAVAKETFSYVHNCIIEALLRWIKRRHPNKNATWRKNKYFRKCGLRQWVFFTRIYKKRTDTIEIFDLFNANSVPIKRHIKIKSDANPFDPAFKEYFEKRQFERQLKLSQKQGGFAEKLLMI